MELCVYAAVDGPLVLVPAPCVPPADARRTFGPLRLHARVQADSAHAAWAGILDQLDRHAFATLSAEAFAALPGIALEPHAPLR